MSRYHVNDNYVSGSGFVPLSAGTLATFRPNCHAKGDNWWMLDIATWSAIQLLYLVEYADFDSQTVLGTGQTSGSAKATGATSDCYYHTIKRSGASNQYRWIENPWSNTRDVIDGMLISDYRIYVGTDNASFDNTVSGLTDTGITIPSTNGAITRLAYIPAAPWLFAPEAVGTGTSISDNLSVVKGLMFLVGGGKPSTDATLGLFAFDVNQTPTETLSYCGTRLIYIP